MRDRMPVRPLYPNLEAESDDEDGEELEVDPERFRDFMRRVRSREEEEERTEG